MWWVYFLLFSITYYSFTLSVAGGAWKSHLYCNNIEKNPEQNDCNYKIIVVIGDD